MSFVSKFQSRSNNSSCYGITSKKVIKKITQHTIDQIIRQLANIPNLNILWMRSFEQLKYCIYDYFQDIEDWSLHDIKNKTVQIEVFEFAYLSNDHKLVIRASPIIMEKQLSQMFVLKWINQNKMII